MSEALLEELAAHTTSSEADQYEASGFHYRHVATTDSLVALSSCFLDAGYFLEMFTCEDRRAEGEQESEIMRLCCTFNRVGAVDRHLVFVDLTPVDKSYSAPSLASIFGAANWFEREVYDMYGITFTGHPELERILLPEDADFFPLRRDFGRIEDAEEQADD